MAIVDTSDAEASLSWADREIDVLADEFAAFEKDKPYEVTEEPDPSGRGTLYYLHATRPVPKMFAAGVGAILHSQRSSLDFLVTALAEANGAVDPNDTYFPIVKSKERLADRNTLRKIRRLDPTHQNIIVEVMPYKGGNDSVYALHWLNTKSKHRRLSALGGQIGGARFIPGQRPGHLRQFRAYGMVDISASRNLIAALDADGDIGLTIAIQIAFSEIDGTLFVPLFPALQEFSRTCRGIINLFK